MAMPEFPPASLPYGDSLGIHDWAAILPPGDSSRRLGCGVLSVKLHLLFPFPEPVVGELALSDCSVTNCVNDQEGGDTLQWPPVCPFQVCLWLDVLEKRSLEAPEERSPRNDFMGGILLGMKAFI